jgi:hypothetical protein
MGGCFIINNNISQAECDQVCAFVRGVLSHGNSVTSALLVLRCACTRPCSTPGSDLLSLQ